MVRGASPQVRRILRRMQTNPTAGVISEAWNLYMSHWRHLIPVAAVVYLGIAVITIILTVILSWLGAIIAALLSIVGVFWVQGALTRAVEDIRDGKADLSVGDTFRSVQDKIGAIAGASILAGIAIGIGLVLLIVPGLYLITTWSVIVPAIVLEDVAALKSFGRSREIVSGNGWNVFGVVVLSFLVLAAFGIVLGLLLAPLDDSVRNFVSNVVSGTLTAPFVALTWTLVYYRLRRAPAQPAPT
jgi:hypothetical protein